MMCRRFRPCGQNRVEMGLFIRRRGNILGKIFLISTYHTNDSIKFDWIAAVQPDIHKSSRIREEPSYMINYY